MTLEDLLAHCNEFLDNKSALVEGDADSLWSDDLITRHLNEAQKILCRRAWVIIDEGHPTAGRIVLKTDTPVYALHKSVLRVYWARPDDQENPLTRHTETALMGATPITGELYDLNSTTGETGRPLGFSTDAGTRRMRIFRTPSATENGLIVTLKVARLPVTYLTLDDTAAEPEVPDDYHLALIDYAAGRCLLQPNIDSQSKADGRELLSMFDEVVREARRDRIRAEMDPARWAFNTATSLL